MFLKTSQVSSVTRGEEKIRFAAEKLNVSFRDLSVLDVGSSTGGFTKFSLEKGATKVFAVEKGTNQMMKSLRDDSRIFLFEKTNIFDLTSDFGFVSEIDLAVADVSFVSLKKVLFKLKNILPTRVKYFVMMKPQFEASNNQLNCGVVKNERMRREIIREFEFWLKKNNFFIQGKIDNELTGRKGNRERFYYLKNV